MRLNVEKFCGWREKFSQCAFKEDSKDLAGKGEEIGRGKIGGSGKMSPFYFVSFLVI